MELNKDIIVAKNLSAYYGKHQVLTDINCNIEAQKITFILGKNGSGKTTFLKSIMGLMSYNGEIHIDGVNSKNLSFHRRSKLVGYLSQQSAVEFSYTVSEMVLMGLSNSVFMGPKHSDVNKVDEVLDRLGIHHLKHKIYNELSGGEQQIVLIARALLQNPKVLLLDEPLSHLDISKQQILLRLLKQLVKEGITVIATIHDPTQAFLFGEDFLFFKNGKLVTYNSKDECMSTEFLRHIFDNDFELFSIKNRSIILPKFYS